MASSRSGLDTSNASGSENLGPPVAGEPAAVAPPPQTIGAPLTTFEGLSNQDNFNVFEFRVNPPDPVGDVGRAHYVEMVNLVFAVYDRAGNRLVGPVDTGTLWADFPIEDCTDESGDPIVLYDQTTDRWLLTLVPAVTDRMPRPLRRSLRGA